MNNFNFKSDFFQSKVARRVTGLFLLSALVPLITTAYLSKAYISNTLIEQGYTHLQNEGKYYGRSLFDRLLFIEMRLQNIVKNINSQRNEKIELNNHSQREFTSLTIEKISRTNSLRNTSKEKNKKPHIYAQTTNTGKTSIYMSIQLKQHNKNTISHIIARINPDFLWGTDDIPASYNICVINEIGGILYCSKPIPSSIAYNNKPRTFSNKKIEHWSSNSEKYISASKVIFLKSRFNSINWKTIVTLPEKDVLAPASTFNNLFPLIIILTLLVVFLLSMTQILRILTPLKKLITGTRQVTKGNFKKQVNVNSNDEFFELAQSFNTMTEQINRQFSTFKVLSYIDQLILSGKDSEHVYLIILKYIQDIIACDISSITILEANAQNIGKTYFSESIVTRENNPKRIVISDDDIKVLNSPTNYNDMLLNAKGQHFLASFKEFGAKSVCIFPVIVDKQLSAIISLGFIKELTLIEEDIQQLRNIADRMAVSLSAAARDKKLYKQSNYDSLTNLPNRQLISLRVEQEIKHCQREGKSMALLFLDLDRFKHVNDTLGHAVGDILLTEVAKRLKGCIRESDSVARLGGDEFTIMLTGSVSMRDISDISDNIIKNIEKPFTINTHEIFIATSIGISVFPHDGTTVTELLKNADTAMYRVKENGRGKHLFFEEKMNIEEMERANIERDIRHALARNEFVLQYQPQVELKTGRIIGVEALIRWQHPVRGLVPSCDFIAVAEETGIIEKIGEWVLRTACKQLKIWNNNNIIIERMAINVSSRQFLQSNFENIISSILEETQVPANQLELEITETVLMDERIDSMNILENLSKKNILLSIDDFGTGFSSLSYLKRFPVNTLKIDRSFMQDVPKDEDTNTIVKSIITLAHTLNLIVIAEGIETSEQLSLLVDNNCDYGQGFYFSVPLDAEDFEDFYLKKNNILKFKP